MHTSKKRIRDLDEVSQVKSHISSVYKIRAPLEFRGVRKQLEIKGLDGRKQRWCFGSNDLITSVCYCSGIFRRVVFGVVERVEGVVG